MSQAFPIPRSDRRVDLTAAASQTVFTFPYPVLANQDVSVAVQAPSATQFVPLTYGVGYTVSGAPSTTSVTVTLTSPAAAGAVYRISGARVPSRTSSLAPYGSAYRVNLEAELDNITLVLQELRRDYQRLEDFVAGGASNVATQAEAEAGASNSLLMTPLRARQANFAFSRPTYATAAAAAAASITAVVTSFVVDGNLTQGDAPPARYLRVGSAPSHAGKIQSADGAWWELIERTVSPIWFGARDGFANNAATAMLAAAVYLSTKWGGGVIDVAGLYLRFDTLCTLTYADVIIDAPYWNKAVFRRNHDLGPIMTIASPTGAVQIAGAGLRGVTFQDVPTTFNGSGQGTNCKGTLANSPYGLVYDNLYAPLFQDIEFFNEGFQEKSIISMRPNRIRQTFNRVREVGRSCWHVRGSLLSGALLWGGGCWGDTVNIEAGFLNGSGVPIPSCDYGILIESCDGYQLLNLHIQSTNLADVAISRTSASAVLNNVKLPNAFLDIGKGDGILINGTQLVQAIEWGGTASSTGQDVTGSAAVKILSAARGVSLSPQRLEGFDYGVLVSSANAKDVVVELHEVSKLRSGVVAVTAGRYVKTFGGNVNGEDTTTVNGFYFGAGAVRCGVAATTVMGCTNAVVVDTGATDTGIAGCDLRNNAVAISNSGTNTKAKGNLGAADI